MTNPVFVEQDNILNPFKGVKFDYAATAAFSDFDGDGDEDALVGAYEGALVAGGLNYFRNDNGKFVELTGSDNPFDGSYGWESHPRPSFTDFDGDGDEDLFVGWDWSGTIKYFRNNKSDFTEVTGSSKPFNGIIFGDYSYPGPPNLDWTDIDGDGDEDAIILDGEGDLLYYRKDNNKMTQVTGNGNPFNGVDGGAPSFADLDQDGDEDLIIESGNLRYFRNDNGSFTELTGNKNPLNNINFEDGRSIAFTDLDGDGDQDVFVGFTEYIIGEGEWSAQAKFKYFQNITGDNQINGTAGNDTLVGTGKTDIIKAKGGNDNLQGKGGKDTLWGDGGNDVLDGGGGADTLIGGNGNDTYIVDNVGDRVLDAAAQGSDTVKSKINYILPDNVEKLVLTGVNNLNGTGNNLNNVITGNSGDNILKGGNNQDRLLGKGGNDILAGGKGNDILTGGGGKDTFIFYAPTEGVDTLKDFVSGVDSIKVKASSFGGGLTAGVLPAGKFVLGTAAKDNNDRFIYNSNNGALFYDLDGTGQGAKVQIAILTGEPTLVAGDILII